MMGGMPPGPESSSHDPTSPAGPDTSELAGLLCACGRGDEARFAELYDATSPRVFGLVLRVLRDQSQAEEVTQEVYLEIWRSSSRYNPQRGNALSWLMTMAHRRAVDRVRTAHSQSRRDVAYELRETTIPFDSTSEEAHRNLDGGRVRLALAELSDVQREAVRLAYFGGCTHREVACRLDLPVGTAKTRIRDGLIRLRRILGEEGGTGER